MYDITAAGGTKNHVRYHGMCARMLSGCGSLAGIGSYE
jgi:hypothetical protein